MDIQPIIVGVVELVFSFLMGILTVWIAFHWFARLTREIDETHELKKNNIAVGILLSAVLISTAFIVRQTIYPSISTLQTYAREGFDLLSVLKLLGVTLFCLVFSLVLSLSGIWFGIKIFCRLTRDVDEIEEIGRNNISVALVLGVLIVVMGLFISHGVLSLLSAIIPMPSFENIRILGM